nr:sulfotransferase [Nereida sp. MMG025]
MLSVNPDALEDDLSRAQLEFGLAKAFEDIGQYAKSFEYLQKANARAKTAYPYDPQARTRSIQSYQAAQSDVDYTVPLPDAVEDAPIFVTGMPRSGTTLIEQIIAAHSNVTSLGETGFMRTRVQRLLQNGKTFHHLNDVSDKLRKVVAEGYLSDVAIRAPKAQRTVDKSIGTYLCLGVVKQIMPNAKFIIVRRDPRDTLLSIYRNFFDQGTHRYAYDFDTLAHEYASFVDMVEFWKTKMPEAIYEADYDALVADPEPQSRALIAAAGLDWEDRCLDFHKSKTSVKTLSLAQVRQPIYKSSQKAWQRYGDAINPLLDALEKRGIHVPD